MLMGLGGGFIGIAKSGMIADYFAATNMLIALLCLGAIFAIAAKAETPFLRVAVMCVLFFEMSRNALSGYLRLYDPGFGAATEVELFALFNTLLILALGAFIVATLRLDRPSSESEKRVEERLERVEGKQDEDLDQQREIIEKLEERSLDGRSREEKDEKE